MNKVATTAGSFHATDASAANADPPAGGPRVTIRLATEADLERIVEISNEFARTTAANFAIEPETLASWVDTWRATRDMHPWLVAERVAWSSVSRSPDGSMLSAIIGFAKSGPWKGRCAYRWTAEASVYVDAGHHGRGVGRAIYARLFDIMRRQGWRTVIGGITQPNEASVRLHESFGFRRAALFERTGWKFDQWWDVGYWQMHLREGADAPGPIRPVREVCGE